MKLFIKFFVSSLDLSRHTFHWRMLHPVASRPFIPGEILPGRKRAWARGRLTRETRALEKSEGEREKEKTVAKISLENLTADFRRGIGLSSIQRGKNVAFPRSPCFFPPSPEGFIPFVESRAKDKSKIRGISLQGKRRRGKNDEEEDKPMNGSKEQEGWRDRGLGDCRSLRVGLGNTTCGMRRRTQSCGSDGGERSGSMAASGDYGRILA